MFFRALSCFFDDPTDVGNLISGFSAFSKSNLNNCKFMVLLKLALENFEHYFASVWDECNCAVVWAFFGIAFLWGWNENWPFPVLCHCWVFQTCWYIECSTFTASSFRIWNSSTGIPSPPLALFIVMLSKAHLTSHSKMSGSRWVITPSWLSGSWRSFLYSFSVYSHHLFLISSSSVRPILFLSFIVPIFAWNVPLVSLIFLKRSLEFSHSTVFLYFFPLMAEEGFLISPCYSLELHSNGCIFPFLLCLLHFLFFQLFLRAPQTTILPFCISFSWGCSWSLSPAQCMKLVHSLSGTLSSRSSP